MINPDEYAQLIDPAVQEKAAQALCDGLIGYIQNKGD
jgi:N-acetylmuramoyl-L-alanine amidase